MVSEFELKPPYRIFDIDIDDDSDFKSLPYFALADSQALLLVLLPPVAIIS